MPVVEGGPDSHVEESWEIVYDDPKTKPIVASCMPPRPLTTPRDQGHPFKNSLYEYVAEMRFDTTMFLWVPPRAFHEEMPENWFALIQDGRWALPSEKSGTWQITEKCIEANQEGYMDAVEWGSGFYKNLLKSISTSDGRYEGIKRASEVTWGTFMEKAKKEFASRLEKMQRLRDRHATKIIEIDKIFREVR